MQRRLGLDLEIPDDFGHWLAGFTDGEGSFLAAVRSGTDGWRGVETEFRIRLRADDRPTLEMIRNTLRVGTLVYQETNANPVWMYRVYRVGDLYHVVLPLFRKFPLRAKKARDFELWSQIVAAHFWANANRGVGPQGNVAPYPESTWEEMQKLVSQLKACRDYVSVYEPSVE